MQNVLSLEEGHFDPLHLTKEASLNRTLLADLPGADPGLVDKKGMELLSLEALWRLAAEQGLSIAARHDVPRQLRAVLDGASTAEVDQGRRIVAEFGRRLGHLVATLRLGEQEASDWRMAYRHQWRNVERVWLGGGVVAALGDDLLPVVRAEARRLGADAATILLAPHPDVLALVGAARARSKAQRPALVFDFGYSWVKRGVASFAGNRLRSLHVLPSYSLSSTGLRYGAMPEQVSATMIDVVVTTLREIQYSSIDPRVVISIATYLKHGRPWASAELYDQMADVDLNELGATLTRRANVPLHVELVHDGTIAAAGLPTAGRDGVIVLGSSLGAGFTLPNQRRLPFASAFVVTRAPPR